MDCADLISIFTICVNDLFFPSELASDGARQDKKFSIDLMVGICFLVYVCVVELVLRNFVDKE